MNQWFKQVPIQGLSTCYNCYVFKVKVKYYVCAYGAFHVAAGGQVTWGLVAWFCSFLTHSYVRSSLHTHNNIIIFHICYSLGSLSSFMTF
jgi:hypothetical protein